MLILREVLEWPAADVAELLGTTTTAVNSVLRRARVQLAQALPAEDKLAEPAEPERRALLDRLHLLTAPGRLRLLPTTANGQPAYAIYQREADGKYHAHAVLVLTLTTTGIARMVSFLDPDLFGLFGLPVTAVSGDFPAAAGSV